jgi:hypothetical protein
VFALGLGKGYVVLVIPWLIAKRSIEHGLGFFAITVAGFRVLGEYRDLAEAATGWKAVNSDASTESSGNDVVEFIVFARWHIHLFSGAAFHFGDDALGLATDCQQGPGKG